MNFQWRISLSVLLSFYLITTASAKDLLQSGDMVAVIGDSITEQKKYSVFIEDYLLMCQPVEKLQVAQFGWGGETASGFEKRMQNDMLRFKPMLITTCFGMNDGGYAALTKERADLYRKSTQRIIDQAKKAGVRSIVVGSPGCVDSDTFRGKAVVYNKTLGELRDIAREVAETNGVAFADVHTPMIEAMKKAKAKYGKEYHVGGGDGVHPDSNGHLVMAYAFLKAIGCDGNIGKITVDLASNQAAAEHGHKVLSCDGGKVAIESSRYPFCFSGAPSSTGATTGILEFIPFNQDLNRFTLVVENAPADKCRVTWGNNSKEFSKQQLADGINLAAEFIENPFRKPFAKVDAAVRDQQLFETGLIKTVVTKLPEFRKVIPEASAAIESIAATGMKHDAQLFKAAAADVMPVKHTITIEPVK